MRFCALARYEGEIDYAELSREHIGEISKDPSRPCRMNRSGCRSKSSSNTTGLKWQRPVNGISSGIIGFLESALARPRNFFGYGQEDIVVLAVALMAGIARAHAFEQGNKRTAFAAMRLFLRANGYDTSFDDTTSWADAVIALVEHRTTEEDFVRAHPAVRGREIDGSDAGAME